MGGGVGVGGGGWAQPQPQPQPQDILKSAMKVIFFENMIIIWYFFK